MAKIKGCRLHVFDLERMRSLLDTSYQSLRKKYLHIKTEELNPISLSNNPVNAKLFLSSAFYGEKLGDTICLYASAPKGCIFSNYAVTLILEEYATLETSEYTLIDDNAFNDRYGKKLFGRVYQKIVSPSFGHPIWHGFETDLIKTHTRIKIDYSSQWTELMIVSKIHIPDFENPTINKMLLTKNQGSITYKYSHEENF